MAPSEIPEAPVSGEHDEFYVGYLPVPPRQRRFLVRIAVILGMAALTLAGALAHFQRDPAPDTDYQGSAKQRVDIAGVLYEQPYGLLRAPGETADAPPRTLILTTSKKLGVQELVRGKHGSTVTMTGLLRGRHGRYVFAIDEVQGIADVELSEADIAHLSRSQPGLVTEERALRGEIVDPKCYTGAMKPGNAKTHKACAINCLRGGIPPLLVTRDHTGVEIHYLLTDAAGGPILEPLLPYVGDPIELRGSIVQQDDMLLLRVTPDSIRRL